MFLGALPLGVSVLGLLPMSVLDCEYTTCKILPGLWPLISQMVPMAWGLFFTVPVAGLAIAAGAVVAGLQAISRK